MSDINDDNKSRQAQGAESNAKPAKSVKSGKNKSSRDELQTQEILEDNKESGVGGSGLIASQQHTETVQKADD